MLSYQKLTKKKKKIKQKKKKKIKQKKNERITSFCHFKDSRFF